MISRKTGLNHADATRKWFLVHVSLVIFWWQRFL